MPGAEGRAIVLAASYPPRDYASKADSHEIAAAVKALAGAVFQQGWHLIFGGHPAVSPLILMIAREYGEKNRVVIYQSEYFTHHMSPATRALTQEGFGQIAWVPNVVTEMPPGPDDSVDPTKCPDSLSAMRKRMIMHPSVSGLVLVGGDTGLRQEIDLFRTARRGLPIIAIGAPGGIARELVPESRIPGMAPALKNALATSRNYLTLATKIVSYINSR